MNDILLLSLPIALLLTFFLTYKWNRTSLIPSLMLILAIISAGLVLDTYLLANKDYFSQLILVIQAFFMIFLALAGIYVLITFLFINAKNVLKKERRTLANSLTLILAIVLTALVILDHIIDLNTLPKAIKTLFNSINILIYYYFLHIAVFLLANFLCNLSRPRKNQDFIIVHGAKVISGKVTKLLAGRVERAVKFYRKQKENPPKIIMSGGQGADEICTEAKAMAEYAISKGVPETDIILEDKSTTTIENMKFSKSIMDNIKTEYKAIYVTSDYHVLRTGVYARREDLRIDGLGSKTAFYYLPTAILREYIAHIRDNLKSNIAIATFVLLTSYTILWFVR